MEPSSLTTYNFDSVLACAMCLGGAKGEMATAANMAIGLMLIFVFCVLGAFLAFIFVLARKARLAAADIEAGEAM